MRVAVARAVVWPWALDLCTTCTGRAHVYLPAVSWTACDVLLLMNKRNESGALDPGVICCCGAAYAAAVCVLLCRPASRAVLVSLMTWVPATLRH